MRTATIELNHFHSGVLCEQCCSALVVPKHKLIENIQENLHALGEIILIMGKSMAAFLLSIQFIVEAIFPHLNRIKSPEELERERLNKAWSDKKDADARAVLEQRLTEDASVEAAYLNSLKLSYAAGSKEYFDDAFYTGERNKLIAQTASESRDPEKDRITLRKYAVDIEQLRLHEMRRKQRKMDLQKEVDYHVSEMRRWEDRAYAASDSKEKSHCERESEIHKYKAYYANVAKENL
ncbi:MAG: hypothetical protein U0103_00325 [Candidatus Obscuribacterales bacterium]